MAEFFGFEPTSPTPDFVSSKENPALAWIIFVPCVEVPGAGDEAPKVNFVSGVADNADASKENVEALLVEFVGFKPKLPTPDFVVPKENPVLTGANFVSGVEVPGAKAGFEAPIVNLASGVADDANTSKENVEALLVTPGETEYE